MLRCVRRVSKQLLAAAWLCSVHAFMPALAGEIEVMHYWEIGDDAKAAALLRQAMARKGHHWKDFAVASGGNGPAAAILRSRVLSGNAPSAAQVKLPSISQWTDLGVLANVDTVAVREGWDRLLPSAISDLVKYKNSYVAVPINVHRNNWLWVNLAVLKRSGASVPSTWEQFFKTAELMKQAGFTALAHGGQPWQDLLLFENVALGVGGMDFYRRALVELDAAELNGARMVQVLQTFRRLKAYTKQTPQGLDWIQASNSVVRGEAGMQMMGDWAKPVFAEANGAAMPGYECVPTPGTQKLFLFTTDSFVLFKVKGADNIKAQQDFASALLSPEVQEEFNLHKGSIPVRLGMDLSRFDRCGKLAGAAFQSAAHSRTLVPSLAMAMSPAVEEAMVGIISDFWRDDSLTPDRTMQRMVTALRAAGRRPSPNRAALAGSR